MLKLLEFHKNLYLLIRAKLFISTLNSSLKKIKLFITTLVIIFSYLVLLNLPYIFNYNYTKSSLFIFFFISFILTLIFFADLLINKKQEIENRNFIQFSSDFLSYKNSFINDLYFNLKVFLLLLLINLIIMAFTTIVIFLTIKTILIIKPSYLIYQLSIHTIILISFILVHIKKRAILLKPVKISSIHKTSIHKNKIDNKNKKAILDFKFTHSGSFSIFRNIKHIINKYLIPGKKNFIHYGAIIIVFILSITVAVFRINLFLYLYSILNIIFIVLTGSIIVNRKFNHEFQISYRIATAILITINLILLLRPINNIDIITNNIFLNFFVQPIIDNLNIFIATFNVIISKYGFIFIVLTPVIYVLTIISFKSLFASLNNIKKINDKFLIKSLHLEKFSLLFADSLTFFPVLFFLIEYLLILFLSHCLKENIINWLDKIFITFQIKEVFKISLFDRENIEKLYNYAQFILLAYIFFKTIIITISNLLSHIILIDDELIIVKNLIFNNIKIRVPVTNIKFVIVKQNIIERLFDSGTILLETSDKTGVIKIDSVGKIRSKSKQIMEILKRQ